MALTLTALSATAQDAGEKMNRKEYQANRVEQIATTLEVDKEKAQRIYDIESKHRTAKRSMHKEMKTMREKSTDDAALEKMHRYEFKTRRDMLNLEEQHYDELRKELSPSQIEKLREAKKEQRKKRMTGKQDRMRMQRGK